MTRSEEIELMTKTKPMPNPTKEDLDNPGFIAIWNAIRTWDINVPEYYGGYCGATGSHVKIILGALTAAGWTGPDSAKEVVDDAKMKARAYAMMLGYFKMTRQLPMPEYKFQKEEHGSMQTNAIKDTPMPTVGAGDGETRVSPLFSANDLNTARSLARKAALEEAAKAAEGPMYGEPNEFGEARYRGTEYNNWTAPQPNAGFRGKPYGIGRADAAAAIRALME